MVIIFLILIIFIIFRCSLNYDIFTALTIFDAKLKRFHVGFFELEMLEMFTRAFFIKKHCENLQLSIVALSSVIKCPL